MCIALKIHHPHSLNKYDVHQIGANHNYFNEEQTRRKVTDFVETYFLPSNALLLDTVKKKNWNVKLHITGVAIELFNQYKKEAIDSLKELISLKNVSIAQSAYYNFLSEHFSLKEYKEQVEKHTSLVKFMFGKSPVAQLCSGGHHCWQHMLPPVEYPKADTASEMNFLQRWIDALHAINETGTTGIVNGFGNTGYNKDLLQKMYRLEKMVKATGDSVLLLKWRKLQDVSYHDLKSDSLENILADFEIVLIKNCLFKIKRSQGDLPFIL